MKLFGSVLIVLMTLNLPNHSKKEPPYSYKKVDEQSIFLMPDPADRYLEVRIVINWISKNDSLKRSRNIQVQVVNMKGIMVYSSTKNVNEFSIFTGGLPEGKYSITCQIDTVLFKRNFGVKH